MKPIVVVGSGASAVHFALSALEKGREVLMLDVGRSQPAPVLPDATWTELKRELPDPTRYFLGDRFESVLFPGAGGEYYGFPPSKRYVFAGDGPGDLVGDGFSPLVSFARGGLAEAWTAGVYPLNAAELEPFPIGRGELDPYYDLIARRIGVSGEVDDLARFMPVHAHLEPPLELDRHSRLLLETYARRRAHLNGSLRSYVGRSRTATLSRERSGRRACRKLGRCLWGCPTGALYTPSITLDDCRRHAGFRYVPDRLVLYLEIDRRRVAAVVCDEPGGATERVAADSVVLAAGTLSTARIFLESIARSGGGLATLGGLMDNRQILVPFVNLRLIGRAFDAESYQFHQLGLGLEGDSEREYVHGQITTLKSGLIHPILQKLPFDLRTSRAIFANLHAALGVVNINLSDSRREENSVTLERAPDPDRSKLVIRYRSDPAEPARIRAVLARVRQTLRALGCVVPPGLTHVRPMGSSVHYAGLLPMSASRTPATVSELGQSHDFENLFVVDGATFPWLPAKNPTFTLMANAARIADRAF